MYDCFIHWRYELPLHFCHGFSVVCTTLLSWGYPHRLFFVSLNRFALLPYIVGPAAYRNQESFKWDKLLEQFKLNRYKLFLKKRFKLCSSLPQHLKKFMGAPKPSRLFHGRKFYLGFSNTVKSSCLRKPVFWTWSGAWRVAGEIMMLERKTKSSCLLALNISQKPGILSLDLDWCFGSLTWRAYTAALQWNGEFSLQSAMLWHKILQKAAEKEI